MLFQRLLGPPWTASLYSRPVLALGNFLFLYRLGLSDETWSCHPFRGHEHQDGVVDLTLLKEPHPRPAHSRQSSSSLPGGIKVQDVFTATPITKNSRFKTSFPASCSKRWHSHLAPTPLPCAPSQPRFLTTQWNETKWGMKMKQNGKGK